MTPSLLLPEGLLLPELTSPGSAGSALACSEQMLAQQCAEQEAALQRSADRCAELENSLQLADCVKQQALEAEAVALEALKKSEEAEAAALEALGKSEEALVKERLLLRQQVAAAEARTGLLQVGRS